MTAELVTRNSHLRLIAFNSQRSEQLLAGIAG